MSFACMDCAVKHSFGERLMKKRIERDEQNDGSNHKHKSTSLF